MLIAFTSCMNTVVAAKQPVWDEIGAMSPDQLVLLGDSVYLDVPWPAGPTHPRDLETLEFMQHGLALYRAQLAEPRFRKLVRAVPTHAIWDDHDFLWNESYEERAITRKKYAATISASRALFNNYAETLKQKLASGSFPENTDDGRLWRDPEPAPGYRFQDLGQGVALHLTDGRSWRVGKTLLGAEQRQQMQAQMAALPASTVHLVASGSVLQQEKGDAWSQFPDDFDWLQAMARQHRVLVLSGDIHDNRPSVLDLGNKRYLYDATASGAAVKRLVVAGEALRNFGLVHVQAQVVEVSFFGKGLPNRAPLRINRKAWRPVA